MSADRQEALHSDRPLRILTSDPSVDEIRSQRGQIERQRRYRDQKIDDPIARARGRVGMIATDPDQPKEIRDKAMEALEGKCPLSDLDNVRERPEAIDPNHLIAQAPDQHIGVNTEDPEAVKAHINERDEAIRQIVSQSSEWERLMQAARADTSGDGKFSRSGSSRTTEIGLVNPRPLSLEEGQSQLAPTLVRGQSRRRVRTS